MKENPTVYILTEGGMNVGWGHISRCSSLCQAFQTKGYSAILLIQSDDKFSDVVINCPFLKIDWVNNKKKVFEIVKKCDILIIDSYLCSKEDYISFSKIPKINVYIDDTNRLQYPAGIVINGALGAEKIKYNINSSNTYLIGANYAFLRQSFWTTKKKFIRKKVEIILITLGSAAIDGLINSILNTLVDLPTISKIIILGNYSNIEQSFKTNDKIELRSNLNEIQMKELLINTDLAITACGQTTYELCRVGTPFIPIITAQNQEFSIQQFKSNDLILDSINANDPQIDKKIYDQIKIFENSEQRKCISNRMTKSIDGNGTINIVNYLINQITKYDQRTNLQNCS
jgi:spore coat polysaccharide biosynthesis predicted glycosyltransferase SpsG